MIVFEDLWEIILKSGFKGGVEITSDSCFSGKVCQEAEKFWLNETKERNICFLKVFSSADYGVKATWGSYVKMKRAC